MPVEVLAHTKRCTNEKYTCNGAIPTDLDNIHTELDAATGSDIATELNAPSKGKMTTGEDRPTGLGLESSNIITGDCA